MWWGHRRGDGRLACFHGEHIFQKKICSGLIGLRKTSSSLNFLEFGIQLLPFPFVWIAIFGEMGGILMLTAEMLMLVLRLPSRLVKVLRFHISNMKVQQITFGIEMFVC